MKILINSGASLHDAEILSRCLLLKGHEVLQTESEDGNSESAFDVFVSYGSVNAASELPFVRAYSSRSGNSVFVFPCQSAIPVDFPHRSVVIPQPVDTLLFSPVPKSGNGIILGMGILDPISGHKTLVQAMSMVKPDYCAVIVGADGYYTEEQMNRYAGELGLRKRVSFFCDKGNAKFDSYGCVDLGVVTYLGHRAVSHPAMELMAREIPLLSSSSGGLSSLVTDGVTGLLHSPGNSNQLARQINHLIDNRGLADMLSSNARCYCENHLSFDAVGTRWTEELEQLCF